MRLGHSFRAFLAGRAFASRSRIPSVVTTAPSLRRTLMKATDLLEKQHRNVEAIFKQLEAGKTDPTPLLEQLSDALAAHMAIEQDIFYPAVRAIDEDLVMEAFEEHSIAELGLKRLLATDPEDPSFAARVTTCKELIEHHVEEEEEELFPKVEKKLGAAKLEEMGAVMKARFDAIEAAGFRSAVPNGFDKTSSDGAKAKMNRVSHQAPESGRVPSPKTASSSKKGASKEAAPKAKKTASKSKSQGRVSA